MSGVRPDPHGTVPIYERRHCRELLAMLGALAAGMAVIAVGLAM